MELRETRSDLTRKARVAYALRDTAEKRVKDSESWLREGNTRIRNEQIRLNHEQAESALEFDRLVKLVRSMQKQLESKGIQLDTTDEERKKAMDEAIAKQAALRAVRCVAVSKQNRIEELETELSGCKAELAEKEATLNMTSEEREQAVKARDDALQNARARMEEEFYKGQWIKFEEAYRGFDKSLKQATRERDGAIAELQAMRDRVQSLQRVPYLGWILWGKSGPPSTLEASSTAAAATTVGGAKGPAGHGAKGIPRVQSVPALRGARPAPSLPPNT